MQNTQFCCVEHKKGEGFFFTDKIIVLRAQESRSVCKGAQWQRQEEEGTPGWGENSLTYIPGTCVPARAKSNHPISSHQVRYICWVLGPSLRDAALSDRLSRTGMGRSSSSGAPFQRSVVQTLVTISSLTDGLQWSNDLYNPQIHALDPYDPFNRDYCSGWSSAIPQGAAEDTR